MDSDDDFMSDVSSQDDFLDMQGSDDESLGEGMYTKKLILTKLSDLLLSSLLFFFSLTID